MPDLFRHDALGRSEPPLVAEAELAVPSRIRYHPSALLLFLSLSLWLAMVVLRTANGLMHGEGLWQGNGRPAPEINSVAVSDGELFAGGFSGMYVSKDAGSSWQTIPLEPSGHPVTTIAAGPTGRFAAGPGILWGEQSGQWVRLTPPTQGAIYDLLVSGGFLFAATEEGLIARELSSTSPWRRLWPASEVQGVAAYTALKYGDRLLVGTDDGVFEQVGGGSSWHSLGPPGSRVLGISVGGGYVHAALASPDGGLARARLGSSDWQMGRVDSKAGATVLVDPRKPEIVYAGLSNLAEAVTIAGVVVSEDAGITWRPLRTRLLNTQVVSLALDDTRGVLYAATNGGGVFAYRERTAFGTFVTKVAPASDILDPFLLGLSALVLLLRRQRVREPR